MIESIEAYWQAVDRELAVTPAAPHLEPLPMRSTPLADVYIVRLTSIGPYRIFGYYSRPLGRGPFPGLLLTPHYGSVNHVPDYYDRERYAVLQIMHRGQRLANQPFAAEYPGLLTLGIESPETYVYRGIVADCIRGAEFLLSRPEVGPEAVGIMGDDLALVTAARRPGFTAVQAGGLLLYRLLEASQRTQAYPVEELNDYLRHRPAQRHIVARTLEYFDPVQHVGRIHASTLLLASDGASAAAADADVGQAAPGARLAAGSALESAVESHTDAIGRSAWLRPLRQAFGAAVEEYHLTHYGARDHDWVDAWLARELGVEPRSPFRESV